MFNKILIIAFILAVIVTVFMYANEAKAKVVTSGLVSYWSLDKANIEGDNAKDVWGDNDGTIYGAKIAEGKVGQALEFDGVDAYVDCGTDSSLKFASSDFTFEAWVKSAGCLEVNPVIIEKLYKGDCGGTANNDSMRLLLKHTAGAGNPEYPGFWVRDKNGNEIDTIATTIDVNDNAWHHLAGVRNSTTIYIYVDGVLGNSTPANNIGDICPTNPLLIGRFINGGQHFKGIIDEVRIYNQALSEAEVNQNMKAQGLAVVSPTKKLALTWGEIKSSQ